MKVAGTKHLNHEGPARVFPGLVPRVREASLSDNVFVGALPECVKESPAHHVTIKVGETIYSP